MLLQNGEIAALQTHIRVVAYINSLAAYGTIHSGFAVARESQRLNTCRSHQARKPWKPDRAHPKPTRQETPMTTRVTACHGRHPKIQRLLHAAPEGTGRAPSTSAGPPGVPGRQALPDHPGPTQPSNRTSSASKTIRARHSPGRTTQRGARTPPPSSATITSESTRLRRGIYAVSPAGQPIGTSSSSVIGATMGIPAAILEATALLDEEYSKKK